MRRILLTAATLLLSASGALAQSGCPTIAFGAVLTAAQWNACFAAKQNTLGYTPVNKAGDTMLGPLNTTPSNATVAGFSIPQGTAPSSPVNGNLWATTAGLFIRIGGVTQGPFSSGVPGSFAATAPLAVSFPAGVTTYALNFDTSLANNAGSLGFNLAHSNVFTVVQAVSLNSGSLPAAITGTVFRAAQANAATSRIVSEGYGAIAALTVARADGTAASPTGVLSGEQIGGFNAFAWGSNAAWNGPIASVRVYAGENISGTSWGSKLCLATTPVTTVSIADSLCQNPTGGVTLGSPTGGDKGAGTLNATALYIAGSQVIAGGGTLTNHGVVVGAGASPLNATAAGALKSVLTGQGSSADPLFNTSPTITGLVVNANAGSVQAPLSSSVAQVAGAAAAEAGILLDAYASPPGNGPALQLRRANGTGTSPTAVQINDYIGLARAFGYGATTYGSTTGLWAFIATENWTDSAQGTSFSIETTAAGGVSRVRRALFNESGLTLSTPLTGTNGGTGVNNGASTITLGGSLVTSGAFGTTITVTGTTNTTLPVGTHTLPALDLANVFVAQQTMTSVALAGTGGLGFFNVALQSSTPATPSNSYDLFADASARPSWVQTDGFVRTFASTLTASRVYTLPDASITVAGLNLAQTWTAVQSFSSGTFGLKSTGGGLLGLQYAAGIAGNNTIVFPNGSTDFSATGGTSQVVFQTSSGAALTVARLAVGDLATVANNTALCNVSGGTAAPKACSATETTTLINAFTTTLNGAVPNPGSVTNKFLRDDGTWQAVAGAGTVTSVTCNGLAITAAGTCPEPFGFENCSLASSVASNLLTIALKDASGADASATSVCRITFRSATGTTGSSSSISVTAALSINTNATGATLGSSNNTAFRFWVVAFNNGGTVVLSLYNASNATSCSGIDESQIQSSTAMSAAATAVSTYYTPNGTTLSNLAIKILGFVEYNSTGLATAGTYASAPNFIQTFGVGVYKPCEVIKERYAENTTATSGSGTTKVQTSTQVQITPKSAANLIRLASSGAIQSLTIADVSNTQLSRGTGPTLFGTATACFVPAGTSNICPTTMNGLDKPNTTSATTYSVYIWETSTGNFQWLGSVGGGNNTQSTIDAMEIQG